MGILEDGQLQGTTQRAIEVFSGTVSLFLGSLYLEPAVWADSGYSKCLVGILEYGQLQGIRI